MGRAAPFLIPLVIIGAVLLFVWGFAAVMKWLDKKPKEPKAVRQNAVLADEAMAIFKSLMIVDNLDGDMDILSERSKKNIKAWAEKYRKVNS